MKQYEYYIIETGQPDKFQDMLVSKGLDGFRLVKFLMAGEDRDFYIAIMVREKKDGMLLE